MYDKNLEYLKQLDLFILAGSEKLQQVQQSVLPQMKAEAEQSGDPVLAQKFKDMTQLADRFEKKLYDLKLSRMISIQPAPQLRIIQNNDQLLVEKIQSSILNTIPLWKNQIVIAISLFRQQKALRYRKKSPKPRRNCWRNRRTAQGKLPRRGKGERKGDCGDRDAQKGAGRSDHHAGRDASHPAGGAYAADAGGGGALHAGGGFEEKAAAAQRPGFLTRGSIRQPGCKPSRLSLFMAATEARPHAPDSGDGRLRLPGRWMEAGMNAHQYLGFTNL
jgi:hypothetical protein